MIRMIKSSNYLV